MSGAEHASHRFRSATDFPKAVSGKDADEANQLYQEMRDCLIFTNRSRAQLVRRNEEHKQKAIALQTDVQRLQGILNQLTLDKETLTQRNQQIVSELELEMQSMAHHLDQLSEAFEPFAELETGSQTQWSFMSVPGRFYQFLQAVKAVVLWWRSETHQSLPAGDTSERRNSLLPSEPSDLTTDIDTDRRERPQMYTDQASQNRSLLDR